MHFSASSKGARTTKLVCIYARLFLEVPGIFRVLKLAFNPSSDDGGGMARLLDLRLISETRSLLLQGLAVHCTALYIQNTPT